MKLKGVLAVSLLFNLVLFTLWGSRPKAGSIEASPDIAAKVVTRTVTRTEVTTNELTLPPRVDPVGLALSGI